MPPVTKPSKIFEPDQSGTVILKSGERIVVHDGTEVEDAINAGDEWADVVRGDGSGRKQRILVEEIASIGP